MDDNSAQQNPALQNPFEKIPRLSKGLGFLLLGGYVAMIFMPELYLVFALIPENFCTRYYFWNWFTAGFLEDSFLNVIFNGIGVVMIGKLLEPIWGSKEFLRFIIVTNILSGASTLATYSLLYLFTGNSAFMECNANGFVGNIAALIIFFKQLMPEHSINLFFFFSVKAKNVPGVFLLLMLFFAFLGAWEDLPLVVYGNFYGWFYLRFLQKKVRDLFKNMCGMHDLCG
eukprot:TRINITY_DN169_c0_g1_i7.p1 TRINITY_DN169_c0_g1~~TRINITY_DN169_c0_g1_i7.p1  ORF type:complete len:228 (+),score=39.39 TRINITY_DN169_c0_g1_i7:79-762(+)